MQNETNTARLENVVDAPVYGARAAPRFTIAEHVHTSRGIPIFICVVDDRIDRAEFGALRNQARKQGGWYSRPWESAPGGFAFMDRAVAERFAEPAGPDDAEEADSAHEPVPPIAAKLRALAEDMRFEIDANLAERSTSTPNRRFYAALAWVDGHRLLRTQAALFALADAHIAKTVPTELADIERKSQVYDRLGTLFDRSSAGYYDIGIDTGEPQCDDAAARALWRLIGAEDPVDPSTELLKQDGISTSADRASDDAVGLARMQRLVIHKQRLPIFAARTDEISIQAPRGARILKLSRQYPDEPSPFVWYACDPTAPVEVLTIRIVGTGDVVPDALLDDYLGTEIFLDGRLVLHFFRDVASALNESTIKREDGRSSSSHQFTQADQQIQ